MADLKDIEISIEVDVLQAQKAYKAIQRDQKRLEKTIKDGKITIQQYGTATTALEMRQKALTAAVKGGGREFRLYNNRLNQAKSGSNKFGMVSQQVGYQVGDFFVQVQSGTSALVAFGQQGTQLAGLLPGVAGAVVGIGLAVGTMLLRSFMQAKGEVKNFEAALKKATDGMSLFEKSINTVIEKRFADNITAMDESLKSLAETMIRVAKIDIFLGFQQGLEKLSGLVKSNAFGFEELVDRWRNPIKYVMSDGTAEDFTRTKDLKDFGFNPDVSLKVFDKFISDMDKALEIKDLDALVKLSAVFTDLAAGPDLTVAGSKFIKDTRAMAIEVAKLAELEIKSKKKVTDGIKKELEERQAIAQRYIQKSMGYETRYLKLNLKERETIAQRYRQKSMGFGMRSLSTDESESIASRYRLKAMGTEVRPQEGVSEQNVQLGRSANNKMLDMVRFIKEQQAEIEITERNATQGLIRSYAEYANSRLQSEKNITEELSKEYDDRIIRQKTLLDGEYKTAAIRKEMEKEFQSLQTQASDRLKILDLELTYGRDSLEVQKELLQQERWRKIEAARLLGLNEYHIHVLDQQWTRENNLIILARKKAIEDKKLLDIAKEREAFEKKIESTLESGLMSMVDGTKSVSDAFRSMATDVIKELYRILVVQQIVNQAKSAITSLSGVVFPSANGNVLNNGKITPYANGGVVGSPTMFNMSGGKTGLMGEAGPEAILPLKRGPNGKLGVESSGGSVVVNQTINVSTGVAQTVRNEIRTLMPQIAEGAKSAVLDAKRRGGSFGSAFA